MADVLDRLVLVSTADRPALAGEIERRGWELWPRYSRFAQAPHAFPPGSAGWSVVYDFWPDYQFALFNETGALAVCANALPFSLACAMPELPDRGWDWGVRQGLSDREAGTAPDTLLALAISVMPEYRGRGYGLAAIRAMRRVAAAHGLARVIAPVRPSLKHRYPLVPVAEYAAWTTPAGESFDPWLRAHVAVGGVVVRPCPDSMTFAGRVGEWEEWVGMWFPASHAYVVPEMLAPLVIDRGADRGVYVEPNVWVVHEVAPGPAGSI